jgi:peptide/nickel transport system substrate-binding protein
MFSDKRITIFLAALFFAASLSAGGTKEERPLRFALPGNPDTLDPQKTSGTLTFQVIKSLYDTLVEPDKTGAIVPALAEQWGTSADGKIWTFRLRQGVFFHDGSPLTSRDVQATFQRIKDPATANPNAADYAAIAEIRTPDSRTVQFVLDSPFAPLLGNLASGWSAILPAALIEANHDFGSHPVGTGPFVFEEWTRDTRILLKKNPSYWMSGAPKLPGIDFRIIAERAVQVQGLLLGQIDVCDLYDDVDVPILEKSSNTKVEKILTSLVMVLAMNTSRPPLSDLRVRQAVNHAIDKQTVLDVAYGGGIPGGTFMDPGDPYYKDFTHIYPYNPEQAQAILAETGFPFETALEMVLPQNFEPHVRAGQMYQEMLARIGLPVKIRLVDWSTWISDVYREGNYDFTVIGHTGKLDPDSRLANYGTAGAYVRWVNPETERLIARARTLPGFSDRKALYDRVLEIMAREAPFVYTGTSYRYVGTGKDVEGFIMLPKLDTPDFRGAALK